MGVRHDYLRVSPLERFFSHVEKTDECWNWKAHRTPTGYGEFKIDGHYVKAHRWIYEQTIGPILNGREIDHLCRNRSCVRPDHLEVVTHAENMKRGRWPKGAWQKMAQAQLAKTHCPKGHPYRGDNLIQTRKDGHSHRRCRMCYEEQQRNACARYRAKRRAKACAF